MDVFLFPRNVYEPPAETERASERLMKHRCRDSNPEMENFIHLKKTSAYEDLHISCA